ncbi:MAG TPA: hypothetical protein PK113_02190, partial [Bacillota bacterium]|nr:hypothetical protein [Bacillota bacterium]
FTEYDNFISRGATNEEALQVLRNRSRDNSRSPMQWTPGQFSGFSKAQPWMDVNENYPTINVKDDDLNPDSVLNAYRFILKNRQSDQKNIICGELKFIDLDNNQHFTYENIGVDADYLVITNFTKDTITIDLGEVDIDGYLHFFGNGPTCDLSKEMVLTPYGAHVYRRNKQI